MKSDGLLTSSREGWDLHIFRGTLDSVNLLLETGTLIAYASWGWGREV